MEGSLDLQQIPKPSPSLYSFLSSKFQEKEDLFRSRDLLLELQNQCSDLDQALTGLNREFASIIFEYTSRSGETRGLYDQVTTKLKDLSSSQILTECSTIQDGQSLGISQPILAEELSSLAKEVARVENVRIYAETALKFDALVGEVEDAVSSITGHLKKPMSDTNPEIIQHNAIKSLQNIENLLASISESRPQWTRLISAVDHRVDRALAILRPQAIADHRALLSSLGWPPPLSSLNVQHSYTPSPSGPQNPLFTMQGDLKIKYCENFFALCNLQELYRERKSRQLEGHNRDIALNQPLWAMEELVNPIAIASQCHFAKWTEKPEFIFALVYKITRDYVDSMDEILQPLVDKARFSGCSCREEWISSMVTSLRTYLAKEIFPVYVTRLKESSSTGFSQEATIAWLDLVDSMISFDKRIHSLITNPVLLTSVREDENLQRISSLSVFCDRPDWLELWAQIELLDTLDKVKLELVDEKKWKKIIPSAMPLSGSVDYKSPPISGVILHHLSLLIERARPLPNVALRGRFLRVTGSQVLQEFIDCLLKRCQEAEGLTALVDDDALLKTINSINGARYCESILKEWCEDVFFLEVGVYGSNEKVETLEGLEINVFGKEIRLFQNFCIEWIEKISNVILRGFDLECRDYFKNKKQWQERAEDGSISKTFISALDYLVGKVSKVESALNETDFIRLWRGLADGLDKMIFSGVLMSNAKFYNCGVERFVGDMEVLLQVFQTWCLRPESFFPKLTEARKILKMEEKVINESLIQGIKDKKWLREKGLRHLSLTEAGKITKNRVFKQ